jgi:hypothetical protein
VTEAEITASPTQPTPSETTLLVIVKEPPPRQTTVVGPLALAGKEPTELTSRSEETKTERNLFIWRSLD